jgi:2-methylcitrate dehydratase PrpD
MSDNVTLRLAQYAASTKESSLPPSVRERAKHIIMDEVACGVFGRSFPAGDLAARYATRFGGVGPSSVLGTLANTTAPFAALANGTAGHADELDGAHVVGGHPGATIVHAAIAAAQQQRSTGAELLNAVVLGYDVGNRLIRACGGIFAVKSTYHLHADFLHALGAAVAVSRLLSLSPEKHCDALALATFQSNGLCALFEERRHVSKSFCNGQFAFAGVSSALQAEMGLEGCVNVLGATDGVLAAWGVEGAEDTLLHGLGADFEVMGSNFKFINAGYPIHSAVEATLGLITEFSIDARDVVAVEVRLPTNPMKVVDNRTMHNICLQDMVTATLVQGGLSLAKSPFPEILANPLYKSLRERVTLRADPGFDRDRPNGRCAIVTITGADSQSWSRQVDWPKGHSDGGGVAWADLSDKWHDALPNVNVDRALVFAQGLEELSDVDEFVRSFEVEG